MRWQKIYLDTNEISRDESKMQRIDIEQATTNQLLDMTKFKINSFFGEVNSVPVYINHSVEIKDSGAHFIEVKNEHASISIPINAIVKNVRITYENQ